MGTGGGCCHGAAPVDWYLLLWGCLPGEHLIPNYLRLASYATGAVNGNVLVPTALCFLRPEPFQPTKLNGSSPLWRFLLFIIVQVLKAREDNYL